MPKNSLVAGNVVPNKAAIYFDYNAPIITAAATTTITYPLPLRLLNFTASPTPPKEGLKNWTVLCKWATANEVNASHFIIQRSDDGRIYKSVGSVAAKGDGAYSFMDNNLPSTLETLYYQLQMVDKNGSIAYSSIIKLGEAATKKLEIVGNPAKQYLQLKVPASLHQSTAQLINSNGKVVKTFTLQQGYQSIDIGGLPNAVYWLQGRILLSQ